MIQGRFFLRIYSILQPKLNDDPQVETQLNKWANNCHISSLFFLLYFSFSFQAWDSICFYCCWCLTLLDTFVIGEVWGNAVIQPKLNGDPQVETQLNEWANNCHISSLFFLLYFSFSFQAWDSICFYCCWCLTLLDTFVIGEVRWEPQSCYETNTLWSEYKNYVQNLWGLFFHSRNYRK